MKYNPEKHNRKSIRLQGYDYSKPGIYFITICTRDRKCFFGDVVDGKMILSDGGIAAHNCWLEIPLHYPNVQLDEFIVMPNHIHGIIIIVENVNDVIDAKNKRDNDISPINNHGQMIDGIQNFGGVGGVQNFEPLQHHRINRYQHIISRSIGAIVRGYKIGVTKWFRQNTNIHIVWQRNFYDQIIRSENDLIRIRKYIIDNPKNWNSDQFK